MVLYGLFLCVLFAVFVCGVECVRGLLLVPSVNSLVLFAFFLFCFALDLWLARLIVFECCL